MMIALKAATPQLPRTTAVADHVVAVDETDSTNALAVQMIGDGSLTLPDHQDGELAVAVVAADRQTAALLTKCGSGNASSNKILLPIKTTKRLRQN